ncbi:MAG TPA: acyl-CoA dehydrogenase family protein [Candidatus Krumholzibacteria bacterium]|nr:acyl-CoA dehydrogenase family protein [Candidatus Krumholzibacteria bacterium]HPD70822.1 acyl-CoA dehydrogenase family protein [Candidatus Krumholzibacteria bacterium]HRY39478.1 acyl-CoA dehydrogenase family protein [Candidatus Krumholzibacteria bacterium]
MSLETGKSPDLTMLCDAVRRLAAEKLNGALIENDREGRFQRDGWRQCGTMGLHGLPVPERHGGLGLDFTTSLAILETLGEACADNGLVFSLNAQLWSVAMPILHYGTDQQRQRFLQPLCRGERIGAHAMTEPGSGSDAMALATRAERRDGGYLLNGTKTFITNAPIADFALVFANVRPELRSLGITAFLVERGLPGVTFGPPIEKMGLRTSPMGEVVLEDVRVPADLRLGPEGGGLRLFQSSMEYERAFIFASHLGAMRRVLRRSTEYARTRRQFDQPISKFPAVADRLVQMTVDIELGALLLAKIARLKDAGGQAPLEAAMAKLVVSEAYVAATLAAIQIFGGYGYTVEYEIEREHRDAVASRLYSGTSDIQRKLIAAHLKL